MPISRPNCLSDLINFIWKINPQSILDVGIGFGTIGVLFREVTDIRWGRYKKWKTRIDGIEIFKKYKNPIWKYIYNKIKIGNALTEVPKMPMYDVIFLGDILEHLEKKESLKLLSECIRKAKKYVIVTTPTTFRDNPMRVLMFNNPYEKHRCLLEDKDFPENSIIKHYGLQKLIIIPIKTPS